MLRLKLIVVNKPERNIDHNLGLQRAVLMLRTACLLDEQSFPEILSGYKHVRVRGGKIVNDQKASAFYLAQIRVSRDFEPPELWLLFNRYGSKIYVSSNKVDWIDISTKSLVEMVKRKTKVFVILGLSDNDRRNVASYIQDPDVDVEVFKVGWRRVGLSAANARYHYNQQMRKFIRRVDEVLHSGMRVVIVGTSAGGSFALNAFNKRRDKVSRIINICGRLTTKEGPTLKSFAKYREEEPLFVESVTESEQILKHPSYNLITKFCAFVPLWDELVPIHSMYFRPGHVHRVYMVEHVANIASVFVFHKKTLLNIIKYD